MNKPPPLLTARNLTKRFPGVLAVDGVDFTIAAGEIVALLGQNGAGKSTVIQILAGAHPHGSYEGEVEVCNRVLVLRHGRLASEHRGAEMNVGQLVHAAVGV